MGGGGVVEGQDAVEGVDPVDVEEDTGGAVQRELEEVCPVGAGDVPVDGELVRPFRGEDVANRDRVQTLRIQPEKASLGSFSPIVDGTRHAPGTPAAAIATAEAASVGLAVRRKTAVQTTCGWA